ncbi:MAG: carbonic anhydrase family protein [Chloroflexota bacterium]
MKINALLKSTRSGLILSAISTFIISGCTFQPLAVQPNDNMAATTTNEQTHAEEKPHWSYSGEAGPEFWGGLAPAFAICSSGAEQSPIDLADANDADLGDIIFDYGASDLTVLNNGHTIQANYDNGSAIELDSERFDLLQFHAHAPSEHTVDSESFPIEVHLVHRSESGQLAVVGIMIEEGAPNEAFAPMWENLPGEEMPATVIGNATINAADFLPDDQSSFRYMGSLTTPPCSEQVRWHVLTTPITMSADQIAAFTDIYDSNNRPIQPLNARTLALDEASN